VVLNKYSIKGRKLFLSVVNYSAVLCTLLLVSFLDHLVIGHNLTDWVNEVPRECISISLRALLVFSILAQIGCFELLPLHSCWRRVVRVMLSVGACLFGEVILYGTISHALGNFIPLSTFDVVPRLVSLGCALLLITCMLRFFPRAARLWAPQLRVVTDLSNEENTRISWALAKRRIGGEIALLNTRFASELEVEKFIEKGVDFLVLSSMSTPLNTSSMGMLSAHLNGVKVLEIEEFLPRIAQLVDVTRMDVRTLLTIIECPDRCQLLYRRLKSVLEPVLALILVVALSPVLAVTAILVKLSSPGPILYRQQRVGQNGKLFTILKFRSMSVDAEARGPQWSTLGDARITKVGEFLRATRLDELPQLWNVMTGSLSFIGPRPERPEFTPLLNNDIPAFPLRTLVKPGITGWAQVRAGYAASVSESLTKVEHDLYYATHSSLLFDLEIICRTLLVAVVGDRRNKNSTDMKPLRELQKRIPIVKAS
jgi:lipopolysaccharide/colanic/teichoic acid biosynthesis glycosyltransferase